MSVSCHITLSVPDLPWPSVSDFLAYSVPSFLANRCVWEVALLCKYSLLSAHNTFPPGTLGFLEALEERLTYVPTIYTVNLTSAFL